ncbi:MarR family winged helix-turn-helix transcriptional regulator [Arsenicicoccus sp. oral taxon 190]|uniref:MarR family winged helix-turn-helix transcriptional regulator n=1 Tax=Arsenicicoccus sp. oral taxon 190 TaxID=1658671 RepID=UPI00067A3F3F|nr:MarR family transcriptional regulator [Arsenicicoccus sp. oral taxon 190]AKT50992.1 hypothetical protein ADJ73_06070 [Arsenicicoccus sp. oral taxon 190]
MTSPADLGYHLLLDVGRLHRWASHRSSFAVPAAQLRLLALVDQLGPARVGTLAVADHSSQPSLTAQLNKTDAAGWTTRAPDPMDARAQMVTLTATGREALDAARRARAAVIAPVVEQLDEQGLRRLADAVAVLDDLIARLDPERTPA